MSGFSTLATIASSVAVALPASAISFNLSYTTDTLLGGIALNVNSVLTTSDSSPTGIANNTYTLTGISGTVNGNAITGLGSGGGVDNIFQWDGTTNIGLTGNGLGFTTASDYYIISSANSGSIFDFNVSSLIAVDSSSNGGRVTFTSLTPATPTISFNLSYTTDTLLGGIALNVNSVLTTSDSSPTGIANNTYTLTGISGTVNGNAITGLGSGGGVDNIFQWDGTTNIGLTGNGLGFTTASDYYIISSANSGSIFDFNVSSLIAVDSSSNGGRVTFTSLTPATPVPFDFDPSFGLLALGGVWTARKMIKKSKSVVKK